MSVVQPEVVPQLVCNRFWPSKGVLRVVIPLGVKQAPVYGDGIGPGSLCSFGGQVGPSSVNGWSTYG